MANTGVTLSDFLRKFDERIRAEEALDKSDALEKFGKIITSEWLALLREIAPYVLEKHKINAIFMPNNELLAKFMKSEAFGKGFKVQLEYFRTSKAHLVPQILLCSMGVTKTKDAKKVFVSVAKNAEFPLKWPIGAAIDGMDIIGLYADGEKSHILRIFIIGGILGTQDVRNELQRDADRATTEFFNIPGKVNKDVFQVMVTSGQLRGKDLISTCVANEAINKHCTPELFAMLLRQEFGVSNSRNPRRQYAILHGVEAEIHIGALPVWLQNDIIGISQSGYDGATGCFSKNSVSLRLHESVGRANPWRSVSLSGVVSMVCNEKYATMLVDNGYVYTIALDYRYADLKLGPLYKRVRDQEAGEFNMVPISLMKQVVACGQDSAFLDADGRIWLHQPKNKLTVAMVLDEELWNVKKIAMGPTKLLAISKKGSILSWSTESVPDEPFDMKLEGVIDVAQARHFGAFIDVNHDVYVFGRMPGSKTVHHKTPVKLALKTKAEKVLCGDNHMVVLDERGDVYFLGYGSASGNPNWPEYVNELRLIPGATDVLDVGVTSNSVVYFK